MQYVHFQHFIFLEIRAKKQTSHIQIELDLENDFWSRSQSELNVINSGT